MKTDEQIKYCDGLIKRYKKKKPELIHQNFETRETYMNNCIYWVNRYKMGDCDKSKAVSALKSLINHCHQMLQEIATT